jgi:hypothetical protein
MAELEEGGLDVQALAADDLEAAHERLYVAALRFVRAFDREAIEGEPHLHYTHTTGSSAALLKEAASRYGEAYASLQPDPGKAEHDG